jgi:hypothetical protein
VSILPISRSTLRTLLTWVVSTVMALTGTLASTTVAASADQVRISHTLFGMHENTPTGSSFGAVHEGWIRLWDTGVQWQEVETSPNHYTWTRLDTLVAAARAHSARVTLVVAGTPSFYSSTPWNVPSGRIDEYQRFVRKVMNRYHGRIDSYQVWNESNISTFWTGTQRRMAQLTKAMHDARDAVAPRAKVVAPPLVTRLQYQLDAIRSYETQRVGGKPVWRYYDAVALSLYPVATYHGRTGVPEDSMRQLRAAQKQLRRSGVPASKPIWDTEVNYGLQSGANGGTAAAPVSASRQAANVVRTYLLQAAAHVKRIAWYRYDWGRIPGGGTLGNTLLTDPDDASRLTAAGRAFVMVQAWMHGSLRGRPGHRPCAKDSRGTYTCVVSDSSGTRRIYWNPFRRATVKLAASARHRQTVLGDVSRVDGGTRIRVDYRPVMVYR